MRCSKSAEDGVVLMSVVAGWMGATFLVTAFAGTQPAALFILPSLVACPFMAWAFVRALPLTHPPNPLAGGAQIKPQLSHSHKLCDYCGEEYPEAVFYCGHEVHLACVQQGDTCHRCGDTRGILKFNSFTSFDDFLV